MKIAHVCLGVVVGLFATAGAVHAQRANAPNVPGPPAKAPNVPGEPADAPNIAGSENMPWNKGVPEKTRAAAREVFLEGNRLFRMPLFTRAAEQYSEALEKWKHPAFYFNLAMAQINLGRFLDARESLEQAMKYGADPLRADRFEEAKKQLVEVERRLGRIRVSCTTPGAEVTLDGVTLFISPGNREVWVEGDAHEATAKKPDYKTDVKRVTIAPGTQQAISLSPRPLIEERPWSAWKPWAVVGAGVVIAGAGGVVHAMSARDFQAFDDGFPKLACAPKGCTEAQINEGDPLLNPRLKNARLEQNIAVAGYIAGGALIAAGAAFVYLNRPHLLHEEANPTGNRVAVTPLVSSDTLGVLVTVSR